MMDGQTRTGLSWMDMIYFIQISYDIPGMSPGDVRSNVHALASGVPQV